MFEIDMTKLREVGEFGSRPWCDACARYGVAILKSGDLPGNLTWGFSEIYTHPPARIVSEDWPESGYHFMINNGRVSGGGSVPDECLALPGFHAKINWGFVCNQSRTLYGREGQKQRRIDETRLREDIASHLGYEHDFGGVPDPVWPEAVINAMTTGVEEGAGLHNIAATLQSPSPEFADMPVTALGVPVFSDMTDRQKRDFLALCQVGRA